MVSHWAEQFKKWILWYVIYISTLQETGVINMTQPPLPALLALGLHFQVGWSPVQWGFSSREPPPQVGDPGSPWGSDWDVGHYPPVRSLLGSISHQVNVLSRASSIRPGQKGRSSLCRPALSSRSGSVLLVGQRGVCPHGVRWMHGWTTPTPLQVHL